MPSRRLILAVLGALPAQAWAQGQGQGQSEPPKDTVTPEAFLRGIYTPYPNHDFKGQPFWQVDRFFAPDLARAIEADMREAKRRGEVPRLDGDPFVDAQDWDIAKLAISVGWLASRTRASPRRSRSTWCAPAWAGASPTSSGRAAR